MGGDGGVCYDGGGVVSEASIIKIMVIRMIRKNNKENYRRLILYLKILLSLHKRFHLNTGKLSNFYCLAR